MSAWPSQPRDTASEWRPPNAVAKLATSFRQMGLRRILWLGCLICVLVAEGMALAHSYLWAAPLICILVIAVATEIPLIPFLGAILLVRIMTDASASSPDIRHTGSVNLSAGIAFLFMLIAIGLIIRQRRGIWPTIAALLFLSFWTAVAVKTNGASTETIREGVREASVLALGVIVYNSRGVLNVSVVTRLIQIAGVGSALLALYQFATHTGTLTDGAIRSNGTFVHPNGAAMYFAIATTASLWLYIDRGHRRLDALLTGIFAAATISTFSFTGLAGLLAMLATFGALRPGSLRLKLGSFAVAGLVIIAFLATPLGAERLNNELSTRINSGSARNGTANTSFASRIYKWKTLIPEWEQSPFIGKGIGTTVTVEDTYENATVGNVPHNEYLRYLVETGVIGLTILLWAVVLLIRRLARRRRMSDIPDAGTLGLAILAGCLVNALADNTLLYTTTGYAAALIVAAVLSLPNRTTRNTRAPRTA